MRLSTVEGQPRSQSREILYSRRRAIFGFVSIAVASAAGGVAMYQSAVEQAAFEKEMAQYPRVGVLRGEVTVPRHAVLLRKPIYDAEELTRPDYEKIAWAGGMHGEIKVPNGAIIFPPQNFTGNPREASLVGFYFKGEFVLAHFKQAKIPPDTHKSGWLKDGHIVLSRAEKLSVVGREIKK